MATSEFAEKISRVCAAIKKAKAILIGAGAGLSAAAGLDYSGAGFKAAFSDYIKKYGFPDLYTSSFYDFPTEEERWARWARHVDYARYRPGAFPLYRELLSIVQDRNYFVITTNVDGQFLKSGFAPEKIFAVQGDYGQMQCARGCHPKVYDNETQVKEMVANFSNFSIPSALVPHCPVCGGNMDIHVRKNHFFVEDEAWHKAARSYEQFIENNGSDPMVLLELGVGYNTPGIIRFPFEAITLANPQALLARVNSMDDDCKKSLRERAIIFKNDIGEVLDSLNRALACE